MWNFRQGLSNEKDVCKDYLLQESLSRVIYFGKPVKDYLMKEKSTKDYLEYGNIHKDYLVERNFIGTILHDSARKGFIRTTDHKTIYLEASCQG